MVSVASYGQTGLQAQRSGEGRRGRQTEDKMGTDITCASAGMDAQMQKGAPQTSIPLGKSLQCPYCHDGQEPGPVNHCCLCQVRVRPRHAAALLDLTADAQLVDVQSSVPPGRLQRVAAAFTETRVLKSPLHD